MIARSGVFHSFFYSKSIEEKVNAKTLSNLWEYFEEILGPSDAVHNFEPSS